MKEQVHVYAVDTKAFYTDAEMSIELDMQDLRAERRALKQKYEDAPTTEIKETLALYAKWITQRREQLCVEFGRSSGYRSMREEFIAENHIISVFTSALTRTLGMEPHKHSDAFIIVRVYFFQIFQDIMRNGFTMNGERYIFFTASAGQIRTKKCVFIKESLYERHRLTLMCGLTVDDINAHGGCNTNKYLPYLALCGTATDKWEDFDIDRAIVVEDMETAVEGVVDYIDGTTFEVERKRMAVPICHTDGCGMMLPQLTGGKNVMVRLPWIKGLLAVFPFDRFLAKSDPAQSEIRDIYGQTHDVVAENIQIIFTKSQFKMWSYYRDWEAYKEAFKKHGCEAGLCGVEDDYIENASLNYQMLQTLTGLADEELLQLSKQTAYKLENLATNRATMLKVLGATPGNQNRTPAQDALLIYPELLQDHYYRETLRDMKTALQHNAWSGKLDIYGKYTYVVPDLYAFCEWLFNGERSPAGLLNDGEVFCGLFPGAEKLDCLRSPHLYREHPVRRNVAAKPHLREWFAASAVYTSIRDLISRVLQFDCDGDKLLVCADKTLIQAAERHMEGIVPLYYHLAKAQASPITRHSIFRGMVVAFTGGNIGLISNSIAKILNSAEPDLHAVKLLCFINNCVIDYAKTLWKAEPPGEVAAYLRNLTSGMPPHFFIYAKGKTPDRVEPANNSPVNRLQELIPRFNFKFQARRLGRFNYQMLMDNPMIYRTSEVERIMDRYDTITRGKTRTGSKDPDVDSFSFICQRIRNEMLAMHSDPKFVADAVILGLFAVKRTKSKRIFWAVFGDIVLQNLKSNLDRQLAHLVLCHHCYTRFKPLDAAATCIQCGTRNRGVKMFECVDCGQQVIADVRANRKTRCDECYKAYRLRYKWKKNRNSLF